MLEDGEIEYESFWDGGKIEVYPSLDRFVFVLRPEGVAAHAMTDQKGDPDHAKPDEIVPLPGAVPVPLKENDWNKARLVLQGDVATLFVNDEKVAERQLPPTNQRTFGLFRWAHRTGVRVRNVIHRGAWPTELPPAEERSFVLAPAP